MAIYSTVRHIIAVTSCKGGVGKSTVSANLAYRLAARGHRVGLYDADVQGPSLPTQLPAIADTKIKLNNGGWSVLPLAHDGVQLMSFGWFAQMWGAEDGEVRGMAAQLATQLLHTTEWGDLDYLIVDSPPGTGDVPRAIATRVPLTGAIVVTTPSRLAVVDVIRGVKMLRRLNVPILSVVENMSSFTCDAGKVYYPFGTGLLEEVLAGCGDGVVDVRLPIVAANVGEDQGVLSSTPRMVAHFEALAEAIEGAADARASGSDGGGGAAESAIALPQAEKLAYHEMPHWPTIVATNELFR